MLTPRFWIVVAVGGSLISGGVSASADDGVEAKTLRRNLVAYFTEYAAGADEIQLHVEALRPDGSWPDIDYTSQRRSGWPTCEHVRRVLELARAYRTVGHSLAGSEELREAVARALNHWLEHDYRNPNWWNARIGVPIAVAPTLILMDSDLSDGTRSRAIELLLNRSKMGMTGQNKVWVAGIAFMKGLLQEDRELMQKARDAIVSELRISSREGLQADYSFHQHGPQQQWGNYGAEYANDMLQWATIFRNTAFALEPGQIELLRDYLLEGSPWIVWRGQMDLSGCGRRIFAGFQAGNGERTLEQVRLMLRLDQAHAELFERVLGSHEAAGINRLVGHKHYWRSDISVHRRPSWYASVKMSSTRVIGTESCNSENLLGLHLGDGATYFHVTGQEYTDIYPLWDWNRLPGTTCRQNNEALQPSRSRCRGISDFVGGVTDGTRGLAAMEYGRDGLRAHKSWFFLDEAVVCLGAGISCMESGEVVISMDQCLLDGSVTVCEEGRVWEMDETRVSVGKADWIHHAAMGYQLLKPQAVEVECARRQNDWSRIHGVGRAGKAAGDIFSLGMSHGSEPRQAAYAYAVWPNTTIDSMRGLSKASAATVLELTGAVQAITVCETVTMAAFFEAGRLSLLDGTVLEVDKPCLIVFDKAAVPPRLHVADPTHGETAIGFRVLSPSATDAAKQRRVELPRDQLAGKSTSLELSGL